MDVDMIDSLRGCTHLPVEQRGSLDRVPPVLYTAYDLCRIHLYMTWRQGTAGKYADSLCCVLRRMFFLFDPRVMCLLSTTVKLQYTATILMCKYGKIIGHFYFDTIVNTTFVHTQSAYILYSF